MRNKSVTRSRYLLTKIGIYFLTHKPISRIREVLENKSADRKNCAVDDIICRKIEDSTPFALTRPGLAEIVSWMYWVECKLWAPMGLKKREDLVRESLDEDEFEEFRNVFIQNLLSADFIIGFQTYPQYEVLAKWYADRAFFGYVGVIDALRIIRGDVKWFGMIRNHRLLVVSPFATTMSRQFERIDKIFPSDSFWPENVEISFLQSVWYERPYRDKRFASYRKAVDYMKCAIQSMKFDIALIGCGMMSVELATYTRDLGKQAIQMGGDLQLLFGIMGKRWEESCWLKQYYNDYWVRPDMIEQPSAELMKKCDNGCYW